MGHIVIVGGGELGYHLAAKLSAEKKDVTIIEGNAKQARTINENLDVRVVEGNGASPRVLAEAEVGKAEMLIAVTDRDEVNIVACLIATSFRSAVKRIARIRSEDYFRKGEPVFTRQLGLDLTIDPERLAADAILRLIESPWANEVIEYAEGRLLLVGLSIAQESPIVGKRLADIAALQTAHRFVIASISRGNSVIIPKGATEIRHGDIVYIMTLGSRVEEILAVFGIQTEPVKRVMVAGGGNIGSYVVQHLDQTGIATKIIEHDAERCSGLAEKLNRAMVIHGNPTDEALLREEHIEETDVFVSALKEEEANLLISLLAKQRGAKRVIVVLNRGAYLPLVSRLGLDTVVVPRLVAVSSILQHIRRGKVLSVRTLKREEAEVLEVIALETSDIVNKPLREIKFPKHAVIGAIEREGDFLIPTGDTVILPGDRVIIFALSRAIPKVEQALTVKLEYF